MRDAVQRVLLGPRPVPHRALAEPYVNHVTYIVKRVPISRRLEELPQRLMDVCEQRRLQQQSCGLRVVEAERREALGYGLVQCCE
jgi:hypothetical protein